MRRATIASLAGAIILLLVYLFSKVTLSWAEVATPPLPTTVPSPSLTTTATTVPHTQQIALNIVAHLPNPTIAPTSTQTPTPTASQTPQSTVSTPRPGSAVPTPTPGPAAPTLAAGDRYFPVGTSVEAIKSGSQNISKQQVKLLIERQVDEHWSVIQSKLGFTTKAKAYAFFLGLSTREATLQVVLETGGGPSHAYGPLQAAEPAYANDKNYAPENDVPEMIQYDLIPQNFYDPGIAVHMGIRHLLHFANQAKKAGYAGKELLKHALIGYNSGSVESDDPEWMREYSDEIGAMAGWYLQGHLTDAAFTWTGNSNLDHSNPWGWY